jgi:hypothetical protein
MVGHRNVREESLEGRHTSNGWLAGLVLIGIGFVLLAVQLLNVTIVGAAAPLAIGILLLAAWLRSGGRGYLIPGSILTGLGVGVILAAGPMLHSPEMETGAVVIGSLAGGFFLISIAGLLRPGCRMWWPLIPGGLLALVSAALLAGDTGLALLNLLNYVWPLSLLALGGYVLYRARRNA